MKTNNNKLANYIDNVRRLQKENAKMIRQIEVSAVKRSLGSTTGCTITEKAPTRAFSWLKAATTAFTFKTILRHYEVAICHEKKLSGNKHVKWKLG